MWCADQEAVSTAAEVELPQECGLPAKGMKGEKLDVGQLSRRKPASATHVHVTEQTPARTVTPSALAPTSTFYASPPSRSPQHTAATLPTLPGSFHHPLLSAFEPLAKSEEALKIICDGGNNTRCVDIKLKKDATT